MPSPLTARPPVLLPLGLLLALLLAGCASPATTSGTSAATKPTATDSTESVEARSAAAFDALEEQYDARLGVQVVDTGSGGEVSHRADERFAFASTAKALLAAALLDATEPADLERTIRWTDADLVTYSPFTEPRTGSGATLGAVAEAMVRESDNTAFNLVVRELGGLGTLTASLRGVGDETTTPARLETELNTAVPGDDRDTSTPRALATTLGAYLLDGRLAADDAALLEEWMSGNATGDALVRAGVPAGWTVADKSGAASYGTRNDVALVRPPDGAPLLVVVMSTRDDPDASYDDALVADATRVALEQLDR